MNAELISWEQAVLWLRNQPEQTDLVKSCFFDDPLADAAQRYYESSEWLSVREYLPKICGTALDLGAGRGISSYALAKDGWNVTALEPDKSAIVGADAIRALANETGLTIKVEENWGELLPFADNSFDLVHARQVLHHARDIKQLCRETARVLKPGGIFIATREHVISRREDLSQFLANHPLHDLYGGEHAYLLSEYKKAIIDSGIVLETVLGPTQSNINLYPDTVDSLRSKVAKKIRVAPALIPAFLISYIGNFRDIPGRLYTFIGYKIE